MKLFDKIPIAFASFSSFISNDIRKRTTTFPRNPSFGLPSQTTELAYLKRNKSSLSDYTSNPFNNENEQEVNNENLAKFLQQKKEELKSFQNQQSKLFDVDETDKLISSFFSFLYKSISFSNITNFT